jgi:hypothetical protein
VTLAFSSDAVDGCPNDDKSAPTFSTGTIPDNGRAFCFNLNELFASNNTLGSTGQYNYTGDADRYYDPISEVSYTLSNPTRWNPKTNYSHIRYTQRNVTDDGESEEGGYAAMTITLYPAQGCQQDRAPGTEFPAPILPWFGWNCQSSESGDCRTLPYNVKSFALGDASTRMDYGRCWTFATYGEGSRVAVACWWSVAVSVMVMMMVL